jgi:hypothetical protein
VGMTDMQYKSVLREYLANLRRALEISPDNKIIKEMIERIEQTLQS